jgi:uncharacterized protein (TIGR03083 family)
MTPNPLRTALQASAGRLAALVGPLTPEDLARQAYPSEWTIADVLSHLGSGAEIARLRLDGGEVDAPPIWDRWNAKSPSEQGADALRSDQALLERLDSLTAAEEAALRFAMGPLELDFAGLLGLRLNEHAVHTWDIAVVLQPDATIPPDAAEVMIDGLSMVAGFAGRPTGTERTLIVRTRAPDRQLELVLGSHAIALSPGNPEVDPDLEMTAESFIRLVYGRLDPDHTPAVGGAEADLELLRRTFPGL